MQFHVDSSLLKTYKVEIIKNSNIYTINAN